jgi:hypothetical protein
MSLSGSLRFAGTPSSPASASALSRSASSISGFFGLDAIAMPLSAGAIGEQPTTRTGAASAPRPPAGTLGAEWLMDYCQRPPKAESFAGLMVAKE